MRGRDAMRRSAHASFLAVVFLTAGRVLAEEPKTYQRELVTRARELRLANERKWLRLLHYRARGGAFVSEADGPRFFLSPQGRENPDAELVANITAFFEPPPLEAKKQHPQCRFPARYAWLKEKLNFDPKQLLEHRCVDFESWRDAIDAGAVSLVWADAFLNNPASMYGHTFLRLHQKQSAGKNPLLDYTINFAATPDTNNALLYTLKGLNGSFPGEYSLLPFYMKTQEYGHLESRDLWDYPLNMTQAEINFLVMHGWEMGNTHFNYYFFTKNCSYQLLTLLEAAVDSLDVSRHFHFTVLPADTLRALMSKPGFVGPGALRPSYVREILSRRRRLTQKELDLATKLGTQTHESQWMLARALPPARRALVLESAHDYLRYREGFQRSLSSAALSREYALLRERGQLGLPPAPFTVATPAPVESGHETARVSAGIGVNRNHGFTEIAWRAALHDLGDTGDGYIPNSQLEMSNLRLRVDHGRRDVYIERFDVVNIVSLSAYDPWVRKPSWKFSTGIDQAKELGCRGSDCMYYDLNVGIGQAWSGHLIGHETYYALPEIDLGFGSVLKDGWRLGAGGSIGSMHRISRRWRGIVEAGWVHYNQGPERKRVRTVLAYDLCRNGALRASFDWRRPDREGALYFYYYY